MGEQLTLNTVNAIRRTTRRYLQTGVTHGTDAVLERTEPRLAEQEK